MSQQWLRQISLVVADGASGLDLSALRVRFTIKQRDIQTANTCSIRVYNLQPDTQSRIQKEFSRVILSGGYRDGPKATLFDGTIVQVRRGKETAVDSYCDIIGADGDAALNFAIVNSAMAAGSTFADRAKVIAQSMASFGVTLGYVAPMPDTKLPRGVALYGMARDHLRDLCAATGTKFSITNGVLNILPLNGALPGEAVVLTARTGLIGFPEQTQFGIQCKCLINPQIKPGGLVQIDNKSIQQATINLTTSGPPSNALLPTTADDGVYQVMVVNHVGDTRGPDWTSELICLVPGAGAPPGLVPLIAPGYT